MFNSLFGNSSLKEKIKKLETQLQEATAEASFWKERYNQYKDEQENLDTIKTIKDKEQIIADLEAENAELTNAAKYWKDESDYWQRNHNTIRDAYIKENHHMSYDVRLIDHTTHKVLEAENPHFMQGGTFCPGGTKELWLNITYNYAAMLCKVLQRDVIDQDTGNRTTLVGLDAINGIYAAETISMLRKAINSLSDEGANESYWHPTEGNVKKALIQLKALADMRPDGVWEVV
jgi:hypothetical protein|nr:MAG TPA: hypothetical protein [Caudoviricetes sp.]